MNKKAISISHGMNGILDDDYTLYNDGTVVHEYDKHIYPNGQNRKDTLTVDDLSDKIKQRLFDAASTEDKNLVRHILKLDS
jgi:hypothetical protein